LNISPFIVAVTEDVINRVLRLDSDVLPRLGEFDGKVIRLQLVAGDSEPADVYVLPFEGGLRLRLDVDASPDVTIQGNTPVFAHMLFGDAVTGIVGEADMQIRGDIKLGQKFRDILEQIEIDWEEHSSKYLGDVLAHKLGHFVGRLKSWTAHVKQTFKQDCSEYVQEEVGLTSRKNNLDRFARAVSDFQIDIDKLVQRVRR
jgi:ubiquinone biosynthesis accessory factor UbiJ